MRSHWEKALCASGMVLVPRICVKRKIKLFNALLREAMVSENIRNSASSRMRAVQQLYKCPSSLARLRSEGIMGKVSVAVDLNQHD